MCTDAIVVVRRIPTRPQIGRLSAIERRELAAIANPERRREWIAGRVLAKDVAGRLGASTDVEVITHGRRPCVSGLSISLSHTRDLVACAATIGDALIGIDVERESRVLVELLPRFATLPERESISAGDPEMPTLLWACKEAVIKLVGGAVSGWRSIRIELHTESRFTAELTGARVSGEHRRVGRHAVAWSSHPARRFRWEDDAAAGT